MPAQETRTEPTFGQVAVRHRFATTEQVNECIQVQNEERAAGKEPRSIGEIMVAKGFMTPEKVQEVLRVRSQELLAPALCIPGYQIFSKVGEGGMGAVYKARQVSMDRLVALKLLPARLAQNKGFIERFYQEARAAGRLNHENIVRAFDVGEASGIHYFSMEYLEGENVQGILRKKGRLDERAALDIALQIARGLDHAHKHNLVHRDVKPENIIITSDGVAKLCDLGLAKDTTGDSSLTQAGTCVGTPHYIAPEQARGEPDIDIRADIYSLGASLFHMLIGEPVFNGPSPAVVMTKHLTEPVPPLPTLRADISRAASAVVLKCMAKEREARYQTPAELIVDFEAALAGALVSEPPRAVPKAGQTRRMKDTRHGRTEPTMVARTQQKPPSSPVGLIATIVAVAGVAVVAAVMMGGKKETPGPPPPPKEADRGTSPIPIPAPPIATGPTQAQEDEAKRAFEMIERSRAELGRDPKHVAEVLGDYDDFLKNKEFKFTRWAEKAKKALEDYKNEVEALAQGLLSPLEEKAKTLAAEKRLLDAAKAFDEFPIELAFTTAGRKAHEAHDRYVTQAHDRIEEDLRTAQQLASDWKFDEARALLEGDRSLCDTDQLKRVNDRLAEIENARKLSETQREERAARAYDDLRKRLRLLLRDRSFKDARAEVEKARKDPALASRRDLLECDGQEIDLLEAAYQDAIEGAKKLARAGQTITLAQFEGPVTPVLKGDEVEFRFKGASMPLSFDSLKRGDVVDLAKRRLDAADPLTHFKCGLVLFYGIDPDAPPKDDTARRARSEFDQAQKKDPRARRYYLWTDDIVNSVQVAAAEKLLEEAKAAMEKGQWTEARDKLNALLKTHGEISWVQERRAQIDAMLKDVTDKVEGDRKRLAKVFAVPPKAIETDGSIDIRYDFENQEQMQDWEAYVPPAGPQPLDGEWAVTEGKAQGRGFKSYYWKAPLRGDLRVEFTLVPQVDHNLGLQFCDNRKGRAYRATLGYDLRTAFAPYGIWPEMMQRLMNILQPKSNSIVRLDLGVFQEVVQQVRGGARDPGALQRVQDRLTEGAHKTLNGRGEPNLITGKPYAVRVVRVQDSIELWLGRDRLAQAKDGAYKEGYLALWCAAPPPEDAQEMSCGLFDDIHIEAHVDPDWLRQQATGK